MCNSSFFKDIFSLFIYLLTILCMYRVYFGHIHPWFPDASSSYTPLSPFQHYDLSFSCSLSLSFKLLCLTSAAYMHLGVESSAEAWVGLLRATPLKKRDSSPADPNQQLLFGVVSAPPTMLETWLVCSCAGLVQKPQQLWVSECSSLPSPSLWLLQSFYRVLWVCQGGSMV